MKICFFADARTVHTRLISAALAKRGHEVVVLCHTPVDIPGVVVEQFRIPGPGLRFPHRWKRRWEQYLCTFMDRFDVVLVFFLHDWGFTPEIIDRGCVVAWPLGSDIVPPPGLEPPSNELVAKRVELLRHATSVGLAGRGFAKVVANYADLSVDRIEPLPFAVDTDLFQPPPRRCGDRGDSIRVGYFKGFHNVYGPTYMVESIPLVLRQCPSVQFDFVGDGPRLGECKKLARTLGVEHAITWHPRCDHSEMPKHLAGWDLTVISSLCESFGLAALESSAMEVPVVATNVGGLPETVQDGVTGLLVEPASPEALSEGMVTLIRDEELRRGLGRVGRRWVCTDHNWEDAEGQWESTLQRARDRVAVMM